MVKFIDKKELINIDLINLYFVKFDSYMWFLILIVFYLMVFLFF